MSKKNQVIICIVTVILIAMIGIVIGFFCVKNLSDNKNLNSIEPTIEINTETENNEPIETSDENISNTSDDVSNESSEPEEEFVEEDEEEFSNDLDDLEFPGDDSEIEEGDELC